MSLEEVRLLANVHDRARKLFETGYRARWISESVVEITSPQRRVYEIDVDNHTCSCPFFVAHSGKYGCKHGFGYLLLLMHIQQERGRKMRDCLNPLNSKHSALWPEWERARWASV